jgi:hypothetical protein
VGRRSNEDYWPGVGAVCCESNVENEEEPYRVLLRAGIWPAGLSDDEGPLKPGAERTADTIPLHYGETRSREAADRRTRRSPPPAAPAPKTPARQLRVSGRLSPWTHCTGAPRLYPSAAPEIRRRGDRCPRISVESRPALIPCLPARQTLPPFAIPRCSSLQFPKSSLQHPKLLPPPCARENSFQPIETIRKT